jgi:hypothetical protein
METLWMYILMFFVSAAYLAGIYLLFKALILIVRGIARYVSNYKPDALHKELFGPLR